MEDSPDGRGELVLLADEPHGLHVQIYTWGFDVAPTPPSGEG